MASDNLQRLLAQSREEEARADFLEARAIHIEARNRLISAKRRARFRSFWWRLFTFQWIALLRQIRRR